MGVRRVERYLDKGFGACVLKDDRCRTSLTKLLFDRDQVAYHLGDFVLMPNHVHLLLRPIGRPTLGELLGPWRSISAHEINRMTGRTGPVWQEECFDHIVRGPSDLVRFQSYIQNDPAKLPQGHAQVGCGSLFHQPTRQ